jgi:hypothetical protein
MTSSPATSFLRAVWGGLWVGGRVTLTSDEVTFAANALNRIANPGRLDVRIPLASIIGVQYVPAFVSSIVAISTDAFVFKVRCFGARRFADAILAARDGSPGSGG